MAEHGIEIICCDGKKSLPIFYRLYRAYNYKCFILLDNDKGKLESDSKKIFKGIIDNESYNIRKQYKITNNYGYFLYDFESYMKSVITDYEALVQELKEKYNIGSKQFVAKAIANKEDIVVPFIKDLKNILIKM